PTRRGFTLVEILGAILIISILAGLVTVGGRAAMRFFRGVNDKATIDNIAKALELYKNKYGEYPPDGTDMAAVRRHLLKRDPKNTNIGDAEIDAILGWAEQGQLLTYWLCGPDWVAGGRQTDTKSLEFIDLTPGFKSSSEVGTVHNGINYNISARSLCNAKGYPVVYFKAGKAAKTASRPFRSSNIEMRTVGNETIAELELAVDNKEYQSGESFYNDVREDGGSYFSELEIGQGKAYGLHPYRHQGNNVRWYAPDTYQLILPGEDGLYAPVPLQNPPEDNPYRIDPTTAKAELDNVTNFCAGATMAEEDFEGKPAGN
ncbi:MAG: prepilin-type N-terminal cleavage/methylation domain-containing protein, partial [Thermoguttaceae bacterium]|nr:prepilin-type N-terminal cleavage/methylation domain-containing protein [Thermoguttaceae bacterium]